MVDENIKESGIANKVVVRKNDFMRMDRRTFVKLAGAAAGALALGGIGFPSKLLAQAALQGVPLPGNKIPQFVDALPDLLIQGGASHTLEMNEFLSPVMPSTFVPAVGPYMGTYVWGYRYPGQDNAGNPVYPYIGPVIIATRKTATQMTYINNLGFADPAGTTGTKVASWTNATDQTLHWANPLNTPMHPLTNYTGSIPAVVHLHGGEIPPVLDGGPDAWYTSDGLHSGHGYYTFGLPNQGDPAPGNYAVYKYPNTQEAANIWFHDHALGITRLNVYAGLAGAYIIDDPAAWAPAASKPPLIPLVIQDRMFDVNGQLFFPNLGINPEHPFWIPEFVGDTIVVNGKVWPFKAVDRQRYSFLFLNGSNARAYDMSLQDRVSGIRGPPMYVIGTDGGYLDNPVLIDPNTVNKAISKSLVIMPGERYEVIIDFNDATWLGLITAAYTAMNIAVPNPLNLELINTAKTPFPGGGPAQKSTTGRIMQFQVSATVPVDNSFNPATLASLRMSPIKRLVDPLLGTPALGVTPVLTRQLTLNEVMGPGGPLEILVNNTKWSGKSIATDQFTNGVRPDFQAGPDGSTYYSEVPKEGAIEQWEIINLTADAHPIHLHLVQFQLMNRQNFDVKGYTAAYDAAFPGSTAAIDPMTGVAGIPAGMYIPMFGPPYEYNTGQALTAPDVFSGNPLTSFMGGNPDVTPFLAMKKGVPIIAPPLPHEAGWKDTVIMYPGQVTRIMVRWAPTDVAVGDTANEHFPFDPNGGHGFVWHCHIIDHEDNEMMRPNTLDPKGSTTNPGTPSRTYNRGTHY